MNQSTNEPNESNELVRTLPVANHEENGKIRGCCDSPMQTKGVVDDDEKQGNEVESFTLGTSGCVFLYNNNCPSDPVVISCVR
eukprot:m.128691 g.128691  ORF g.128691 m.128691 type:complete len:83 (+) comp29351_c1_seq5:958-1206(+)